MTPNNSILFIHDADGNLVGVQLSAELWKKIEPLAKSVCAPGKDRDHEVQMNEFAEFMRFWDFPYAYDPAVRCPACGLASSDWRTDPDNAFVLCNSNLGGLLVFHCRGCGSTIRHKYFKDHMAVEYTPA